MNDIFLIVQVSESLQYSLRERCTLLIGKGPAILLEPSLLKLVHSLETQLHGHDQIMREVCQLIEFNNVRML